MDQGVANIDTDFDVDTYTGAGRSILNAGDHDFDGRHERTEDLKEDRRDRRERRRRGRRDLLNELLLL